MHVEGCCLGQECFYSKEKEVSIVGKKVNSKEQLKQAGQGLGL